MTTIEITADLLDDQLIVDIMEFVNEQCKATNRRAIPSELIFQHFKPRTPTLMSHHFKGALSKSVEKQRLVGFKMYRGKMGGLGVDDGREPAPKKIPAPSKKKAVGQAPAPIFTNGTGEACTLSTDIKEFIVPISQERLLNLLVPIFGLEQNVEGTILIGDQNFSSEDENVPRYIENFAHAFIKDAVDSDEEDDTSDDVEDIRKTA